MPLSTGTYLEAKFEKSWGVSPGGGFALLPGNNTFFDPGDEIVLNLGARTFHGMVTARNASAEGVDGTFTRIEIADNRIHLQMDITKCVWNMTEVRADNPATPGIDRQRRYWSITPGNHPAQKKLWTDDPYTAAEIIDSAMEGESLLSDADVEFEWIVSDPHKLLNKPVYEIDANDGAKLGSVLSEICSQLGILFTVTGYNTLLFARKGEGTAPYIDPAAQSGYSAGSALSHADTRIEVVGGRNVYQDVVTLEPWWVLAWEVWSKTEADFLDVIETLWGADWAGNPDEVKALKRSIKSRQITVREFAVKYKAHSGLDVSDYGMWGEVCRMEMPAWRYGRDIVWKAFRVPRDYVLSFSMLGGITGSLGVQSLLFHEHLIAACDYNAATGDIFRKDPPEWYPPDAAFVLAQGFRVNVLDPRLVKSLTPAMLSVARTVWAPQNGFTLDPRPESLGVIFDEAVAVDSAEDPFFTFPNRDLAGITSTHPLYNVCVPNAAASVSAPAVKMAIAWQANKYLKVFGTGARRGVAHSDGIAGHYCTQFGIVTDEVPYADGSVVDDKAAEYAARLIGQQEFFDMGTIRRVGGAGTELSGVVDRVEVRIERLSPGRGGLVEEVTLTKERVPIGYFNSRLLDRFARFHDLFQGQRANRVDILTKQAQLVAKERLYKSPPPDAHAHKDLQAILSQPVGAPQCGPRLLEVGVTPRAAGSVVWLSGTSETPDDSGAVFAGIVVAAMSDGMAVLATQGAVPVKVQGPFTAGDSVGCASGSVTASVDGARALGKVQVDYTGTDIVTVPVLLGAAGAAKFPLQCLDASTKTGSVWTAKVRVRYGFAGGKPADVTMTPGDTTPFVITLSSAGTHYLYSQIYVEWDETWGFWNLSGSDTIITPSNALKDAEAANAWCPLCSLEIETVEGESGLRVKSIAQIAGGSQSWSRLPAPTIYVDTFDLE